MQSTWGFMRWKTVGTVGTEIRKVTVWLLTDWIRSHRLDATVAANSRPFFRTLWHCGSMSPTLQLASKLNKHPLSWQVWLVADIKFSKWSLWFVAAVSLIAWVARSLVPLPLRSWTLSFSKLSRHPSSMASTVPNHGLLWSFGCNFDRNIFLAAISLQTLQVLFHTSRVFEDLSVWVVWWFQVRVRYVPLLLWIPGQVRRDPRDSVICRPALPRAPRRTPRQSQNTATFQQRGLAFWAVPRSKWQIFWVFGQLVLDSYGSIRCGLTCAQVLGSLARRFRKQPRVPPLASHEVSTLPYPKREDGSAVVNVDSYRKLEVIDQEDLYETFDGSSKSWERLAMCLSHMSKVGHPWKSFVAKLQGHMVFQTFSDQNMVTEASLFLWLLEISDQDVQKDLMRQHMTHQPVPFATPWPRKRFCDELLWTMWEVPTLCSLKLNDMQGVSHILNQIFDTNFERGGSRFAKTQHFDHPYTQIQYDADMKPESRRHFAVIDVHGRTSPQGWPLELAKSCQFVLLHIKEKDLKSREVTSLVQDIETGSRCIFLFILIWDDVCEEVRQEGHNFDSSKAGPLMVFRNSVS